MNQKNLLPHFKNSILVAAHPDDEILWFSSILNMVNSAILCFVQSDLFQNLKMGREKSFSEYPIDNIVCLNFVEASVYSDKNWIYPQIDKCGLHILDNNPGKKQYVHNYLEIKNKLKNVLSGYTNVFTHNPWGEYGHEEHVQISLIIRQLQEGMGFNLWFSTYCSNKSFPLMFEFFSYFSSEIITLPTNKNLANEIKKIYQKNNCWTWSNDFQWVNKENFIKYEKSPIKSKNYYFSVPVNAIKIPPFNPPNRKKHFWKVGADKVERMLKKILKRFL
jgi:hypothetical protein